MLAWSDSGSSLAEDPWQNICAVIEAPEIYIHAGKECTDPPVGVQCALPGAVDSFPKGDMVNA